MVQLNFTAEELPTEIKDEFSPLPDGTYNALLVSVDAQDDGQYKFEFHITAGEYTGRKIFEWHEFQSEHQWKNDNALQLVGSLANAFGVAEDFAKTKDTGLIINKPFLMDLICHQGKDYKDRVTGATKTPNPKNIIKGVHPFTNTAASPQQPAQQEAASSTPVAAAGGAPPWKS
jgi:hypothetical protein